MNNEQKKQRNARNVLSNSLVKTTLAASLLLSGGIASFIVSEDLKESIFFFDTAYASSSISPNLMGTGYDHSFLISSDGSSYAWGRNSWGQIGDGSKVNQLLPLKVNSLFDLKAIDGGSNHTIVLTKDGTVYTHGNNENGQLGDGTITQGLLPKKVNGLSNVKAIAAGDGYSLAVTGDGSVYAWGINSYGQLGDGTATTRRTPMKISGLSNVVAISAGKSHSLAMTSDGSVYAWGFNRYGQIGDGSTIAKKTPVKISSLSNVVGIEAGTGSESSYAITSDGNFYSWGWNSYGQLGDGTTTSKSIPEIVTSLPKMVSMEAGMGHVLGVTVEGDVFAWGYNNNGQVGNGTKLNQIKPLKINGLSNVTNVEAGFHHSIAASSSGSVYGWGDNSYGQLGDGKTTDLITPTVIVGLKGDVTHVEDTALVTATTSVVKAESTKLQADVDSSRLLVNNLSAGTEKTSLTTRLDTVQKAIDDAKALAEKIATATASVVKAEGSKLQVDVTAARTSVEALPTGTEKTNLNSRLDTVQTAINLAIQIATAMTSVVKAEGSKLQVDVTTARTLVNALPSGAEKTNLTSRLDTVQTAINLGNQIATAMTSVVKAEETKLQADVTAALTLVNALPTGTEKTSLTNRLNVVQKAIEDAKALAEQIATATTSVVKAEESKLQVDVTAAFTLVNALPSGTEKTNLTNRLNVVQKAIDDANALATQIATATASVVKSEVSMLQVDVTAARTSVEALPTGTEKTNLTTRLNVVQKAINDAKALAQQITQATAAVVKAEETNLDVDIQSARQLTELLPSSQVKTELLDRIALVEKAKSDEALLKNAKEAVEILTENSTKAEIDSVKELVSLLPDSIEKNELNDRITNIELVQKAISSVEQAERMQTNYNISLAEKAILLLPDGLKKTELTERITELKLTLEAESKVVSAETTKREPYLTEAYVSVNKLKDGLKKTQLMGRLQAVKDAIEIEAEKALLTEATSLVVLAELHQREPYLMEAKAMVSKLKGGPDKKALEERIQAVEDVINTKPQPPVVDPALLKAAEQQVTFAERYKREPYFTRAQEAIDKLPSSEERLALQKRLDMLLTGTNQQIAQIAISMLSDENEYNKLLARLFPVMN